MEKMNGTHEIVATGGTPRAPRIQIAEMKEQVQIIQEAMRSVMIEGTHFGKIPGVEKACLLKAGAEKLSMLFRLLPRFNIDERNLENAHREFFITCELSTPDGSFAGQGVGSCSTLETKYRYRKGGRTCPACGSSSIIQSTDFKTKQKDGFLCFAKRGGCGAKFAIGSPDYQAIESTPSDRVENPDLADCYNTVLKMAKKRAHVDAIITATAASDIFTQDLDDGELPPAPRQQAAEPRAEVKPVKNTEPEPLANPLAHVMTTNNPTVLNRRIGTLPREIIERVSTPAVLHKLSAEDRVNVIATRAAMSLGTYEAKLEEFREIFGADPVDDVPPFEN